MTRILLQAPIMKHYFSNGQLLLDFGVEQLKELVQTHAEVAN